MRCTAGITCLALLSACAHSVPEPDWQEHARTDVYYFEPGWLMVEELAGWEFGGRIAARNGTDGGQASLRWSRNEDLHKVELYGPFGGGAVRMEYGPRGATLWDSKENRYNRENAQALLDEVVGWRVPFSDLNYWLFGLASRAEPAIFELGVDGNLSRLQQSGWDIEFSGYRELGGRIMPGRVFATRLPPVGMADETPDEVSVRMVSREWKEN